MFKYLLPLSFFLLVSLPTAHAETISNITLSPSLDISYFGDYRLYADVSGSPSSVLLTLSGVNGDGSSHWDFHADGIPHTRAVTKTMSYDAASAKWMSETIRPDEIYPEIFFAPSTITWNNVPTDMEIRKNNYQILHFSNPFTVRNQSTFFIEMNAAPQSTENASDLMVYLIRNNKGVEFFNDEWREGPDAELVGSFSKDAYFSHMHTTHSSHLMVRLSANADGTIGSKNLNINGDFWVVLYSNSPKDERGWNVRHHSSALCNNNNGWYLGNQAGWGTAPQTGCPDVHVHMARRDVSYSDGVTAAITTNYPDDSSVSRTKLFSFGELPNLAPNSTSFTSPVPAGVYDGGTAKTLEIAWNHATDPNDDELTYEIALLDANGVQVGASPIFSGSGTSHIFDITDIPNGLYGLSGKVCDRAPLCTSFALPDSFSIMKAATAYSAAHIAITSDNAGSSSTAKVGDTITLSFTANENVSSTLKVEFYSGGTMVMNAVSLAHSGDQWTASYTVSEMDAGGIVDFIINADNLDLNYSDTTDGSYVSVTSTNGGGETGGVGISASAGNMTSSGGGFLNYPRALESNGIRVFRISVNGGVTLTTSTTLSIGMNADPETVKEFELSLDPDFMGASRVPYQPSTTFTLPDAPGTYVLYLKYFSAAGNQSSVISTAITYQKEGVITETTASKEETIIIPLPVKYVFNRNLKLGMVGEDVKELQRYLNANGFLLITSGPGSQGQETERFGTLTKAAVVRLQEANLQFILTPLGLQKGTGNFFEYTRAFVNSH